MNKIEAVIFDLGRVLVDVDITRGIFGLFDHSSAGDTEAAVSKLMRDPALTAFNIGKLSSEQFYQEMKKKFSLDWDYAEFARLWCDVFGPMAGMPEIVKELSGKVRLGLLSDTDPLHWEYIRQNYALVSLIKKPTLSYETGFQKPGKEAYLAAVKNTGVDAAKCLYVDDLTENVQGAIKAGLQAVQFTGADALRKEIIKREILS